MSAHSDRVTVAEVNDFLSDTLRLDHMGRSVSLRQRIAHQQRKAELLSRIADEIDTAHAHATAAEAWERLTRLCGDTRNDATEAGDV